MTSIALLVADHSLQHLPDGEGEQPHSHHPEREGTQGLSGELGEGALVGGIALPPEGHLDGDPRDHQVQQSVADQPDGDQDVVSPAPLHLGDIHGAILAGPT